MLVATAISTLTPEIQHAHRQYLLFSKLMELVTGCPVSCLNQFSWNLISAW